MLVANALRCTIYHRLVPHPTLAQLWELRHACLLTLQLGYHGRPHSWVLAGAVVGVIVDDGLAVDLVEVVAWLAWLQD